MPYKLKDSELAAVLISQDELFTTTTIGNVVFFEFENEEKCLAIKDLFQNHQLLVDALDLMNAVREVKKIIIRSKQ